MSLKKKIKPSKKNPSRTEVEYLFGQMSGLMTAMLHIEEYGSITAHWLIKRTMQDIHKKLEGRDRGPKKF